MKILYEILNEFIRGKKLIYLKRPDLILKRQSDKNDHIIRLKTIYKLSDNLSYPLNRAIRLQNEIYKNILKNREKFSHYAMSSLIQNKIKLQCDCIESNKL